MSPSTDQLSSAPCVRLFLSVDLSGSTRLKNLLNQQQLWIRCRAADAVIDSLRAKGALTDVEESVMDEAVLTSLDVGTVDSDWASVIEAFYKDFHTKLRAKVDDVRDLMQLHDDWPKLDVEPWKAIGDELIYVFDARSRRQVHWLVVAFLAALRSNDRLLGDDDKAEHHGLRLKGSGWVAGFPVRNRRVRLPGKTLADDYLGPEIDTGFRIGRCTRPGMFAVSVELAELLAEIPTTLRPMTGMIVGWEKLKGVWEDRHYPVIWVDMPEGHLPDLGAEDFDDWELEESPFSRKWHDRKPPKPNLPELRQHLTEIRRRLPRSLGIVDPYILGDPDFPDDEVDESHQEIHSLLERVDAFEQDASRQDDEASTETTTTVPPDEIDSIVDRAVSPSDEPEPRSPSGG